MSFTAVEKVFMRVGSRVNMVRIISYCCSIGINYDGLKSVFLEMERNNSRIFGI